MNPHLPSFISGLDERYPDDSTDLSMADWICANTHLRKKPFSFRGYEFQKEIVNDMHSDVSVIKISQVGLTEVQIRKMFGFLKRNVGTNGIFSFPNQPMRDRVSQTRIKLLIEGDEVFNGPLSAAKPVRQKGIYQVDESFGYITGTTEGEATSISADILMEDEVDLADQAMRSLFQSRLQNSIYKITQRFSTPTYDGYGIDALYSASDRREYQLRCSCGHWQVPLFRPRFLCLPGLRADEEDFTKLSDDQIEMIDMNSVYVRCEKCSKPLDLAHGQREWVIEHPTRRSHGYRVRPFTVNTIKIPYIFDQMRDYRRKDNLKGWWNTVIGEGYPDKDARISEEDMIAIMKPGEPDQEEFKNHDLFMGIDMGETCHVVIGRPHRLLEFRQVPRGEIIEFAKARVDSYGITRGGVDLYPYSPTAEAIREVTSGIVMPMAYATVANAPPIKEKLDEFGTKTHYVLNRTMAIDLVAKQCRNRTWEITGYGDMASVVKTHFRDMIRIEVPEQAPIWNKQTGDDHYLHATALQQTAVRLQAGQEYSGDVRESVVLRGGPSLMGGAIKPIFRGADHRGHGVLG